MPEYIPVTEQPLRTTIVNTGNNRAPLAATWDSDFLVQPVILAGVEYEVRFERLRNPVTNLYWWQETDVFEVVPD